MVLWGREGQPPLTRLPSFWGFLISNGHDSTTHPPHKPWGGGDYFWFPSWGVGEGSNFPHTTLPVFPGAKNFSCVVL